MKFLCSYRGKILPRHPDGKLRYVGGDTRVLAVDRSISFTDLLLKLQVLCGSSQVSFRCQLPKEDLDTLISITSDEDLANIINEYDLASKAVGYQLKIRGFLYVETSKLQTLTEVKVAVTSKSNTMKLLCSYGGKILPRQTDGKLGYTGGENRVLCVDRTISFSALLLKLEVLSGSLVSLRCQLPEEDLDTLVSITSEEDLANIVHEYDVASKAVGSPLKIRVFLSPLKSPLKKVSPPPSKAKFPTTMANYVFSGVYHPISSPIGYQQQCYYTATASAVGVPLQTQLTYTRLVLSYGNYWQQQFQY